MLLWLLLLWQVLGVAAHVHAARPAAPGITAMSAAPASTDDPAACPLCRAQAQAGDLLLPPAPVWRRPAALRHLRPAVPAATPAVRRRLPRRQSRAPPVCAA